MLLFDDEPPAFETVREDGASPLFLLCDHASARMPRRLGDLGLDAEALASHIAWDPGAKSLAHALSARFDATLVCSGYSRLAIDCNRPLDVASSIPAVTCEIPVPGNAELSAEARAARQAELFWPYHREIARRLATRDAAGRDTVVVSVHSFTPSLYGKDRPWHVGVMYGKDPRLAHALLDALAREPDLVVGDNEPYRVTDGTDYGVPVYAERVGRPGVLLEVRQDLLATDAGVARMTEVLARALASAERAVRAPTVVERTP